MLLIAIYVIQYIQVYRLSPGFLSAASMATAAPHSRKQLVKGGVWLRACSAAFMQQVLPTFCRPTKPGQIILKLYFYIYTQINITRTYTCLKAIVLSCLFLKGEKQGSSLYSSFSFLYIQIMFQIRATICLCSQLLHSLVVCLLTQKQEVADSNARYLNSMFKPSVLISIYQLMKLLQ